MRRKRPILTRAAFEEIKSSRSFSRAIAALEPYVQAARGRVPTIGLRTMSAEELREYNRQYKAAQRKAAKR